ncbi:MAG: hypothetical protein HYR71_06405, partial [Chloroflexi bacterium]|nr:hypothetical protein [Chloroflexota bacterium]
EARNSAGAAVPLTPRYLEAIIARLDQVERAVTPNPSPIPGRGAGVRSNPALALVAKLYEQEIGGLTEKISDQLRVLVAEYPGAERWQHAFEAAATMNKRNLRYVVKCVKNYGNDDVQHHEKATTSRGASKSERHRDTKRRRIKDYEDYWDEDFKTSQQKPSGGE